MQAASVSASLTVDFSVICQDLDPEWVAAAKILAEKDLYLGKMDALANEDVARRYVKGRFPSIQWFS